MKNPLHFVTFLLSPCPCEQLFHTGWGPLVDQLDSSVFHPSTTQERRGICYKNQDSNLVFQGMESHS